MGNIQSMISKGLADGGEDLVNRPSVTAAVEKFISGGIANGGEDLVNRPSVQKSIGGGLDQSDSLKKISLGVNVTGASMVVFAICNLFMALKISEMSKKKKEKKTSSTSNDDKSKLSTLDGKKTPDESTSSDVNVDVDGKKTSEKASGSDDGEKEKGKNNTIPKNGIIEA